MKTKTRKSPPRFFSRNLNVSTCAMSFPAASCHVWTSATQGTLLPSSRIHHLSISVVPAAVRMPIGSIERLQARPEGLVETLQR